MITKAPEDIPTTRREDGPRVSVYAQYVKDMSFENPRAPVSLTESGKPPRIEFSLDTRIEEALEEKDTFKVELIVHAEAHSEQGVLFIVDIVYGGLFHLMGIDPKDMHAILGAYCPSVLFPFLRKILADATQSGGFQPLMIEPIDFGALYAKKMSQAAGASIVKS